MKRKLSILLLVLLSIAAMGQVSSQIARRFAPGTLASLGTPVDNAVRWCSNCNVASPCTSGGTGAYAYGETGGDWNCNLGAAGGAGITNGAAANVIPKSDGTNLVTSQITDNGTTVAIGTSGSAVTVAGVPQPKVYVALLTQTSTNAPVATVLANTLGGTVVWGYSAAGRYTATLAGAFLVNKTSKDSGADASGGYIWDIERSSNDALLMSVNSAALEQAQELGAGPTFVQIFVYP